MKDIDSVRREIELGGDATRKVGAWTRYLASEEVVRGGELAHAAQLLEAPQWPSVVRETFSDLYGAPGDESIAPDAEVDGSKWVRTLVDTMTRVPEWTDLRARTHGDEWASGMAIANIAQRVRNELEGLLPKEDRRAAEDRARTLEELVKELEQDAGEAPTPEQQQQIEKARKAARDADWARAQATAADNEVANILGDRGGQKTIRSLASSAAAQAVGEIDAMRAAMRGLGAGQHSSSAFRVNAPSAALIDALRGNAKLARVAALAGRLRAEAARKQTSKTNYAREQVSAITAGNDIGRLIPSELVYLADDEAEAILFRKLSERSALEYELTGLETSTRGPIVLCLDESGSMTGARDEWAKAVALTLAEVAAKQRRDFVLVHYDGSVTRIDRPRVRNGISLAELVEMVCHFSGGGTVVANALHEAHAIIETAKAKQSAMKDADVIVISDGLDSSVERDDVLERLAKDGISVHGIAIACDFTGKLRAACSSYVKVSPEDFHRDGAIDAVLSI